MTVDTKLANQIRLKAQRQLAKAYPEQFREIHDQLRRDAGLPPVGAGAAQLAEENRRLREELEKIQKQGSRSGARAKATA